MRTTCSAIPVRDVERDRFATSVRSRDLLRDTTRVVAARGCDDVSTLGGKSERNPAPDAPRSACHDRDAA